jgi:hypothetical protein
MLFICGIFAGIGYARLCAVVQYATGVPWLIVNKNIHLLIKHRICNQQVAGSTPVSSSENQ